MRSWMIAALCLHHSHPQIQINFLSPLRHWEFHITADLIREFLSCDLKPAGDECGYAKLADKLS